MFHARSIRLVAARQHAVTSVSESSLAFLHPLPFASNNVFSDQRLAVCTQESRKGNRWRSIQVRVIFGERKLYARLIQGKFLGYVRDSERLTVDRKFCKAGAPSFSKRLLQTLATVGDSSKSKGIGARESPVYSEKHLTQMKGEGISTTREMFPITDDDVASDSSMQSENQGSGRRVGARTRPPSREWRRNRAGSRNEEDEIMALGRCMSLVLRHRALELGLAIRSDGYVTVADLLRLKLTTKAGRKLASHSVSDVRQAVVLDDKQRFGLLEEGECLLIRANQGHSIPEVQSELLLRPVESAREVPVCVHGTYFRHLAAILAEGLRPMTRNHVHFARGLPQETSVISGMRKSCQLLIYLDVEKALKDGMKLYLSANDVVLTNGIDGVVAPRYFAKILEWPSLLPASTESSV